MRPGDCRFHGRHRRARLVLSEECPDCGHRRDLRRGLSPWAARSVPWALWANALLLLCLLLG